MANYQNTIPPNALVGDIITLTQTSIYTVPKKMTVCVEMWGGAGGYGANSYGDTPPDPRENAGGSGGYLSFVREFEAGYLLNFTAGTNGKDSTTKLTAGQAGTATVLRDSSNNIIAQADGGDGGGNDVHGMVGSARGASVKPEGSISAFGGGGVTSYRALGVLSGENARNLPPLRMIVLSTDSRAPHTYNNVIPSDVRAGDIITLTQTGVFTVPLKMLMCVEMWGGAGGYGANSYDSTFPPQSTAATKNSGGSGGFLSFDREFDAGFLLNYTAGANGANNTSAPKTPGQAGTATVLRDSSNNIIAQADGGDGGGSGVYGNTGSARGASVKPENSISAFGGGGVTSCRALGVLSGADARNLPPLRMIVLFANEPPTIPNSITTDGTTTYGQPITVSWDSSSDADGDAIQYTLERQVDTQPWTTVAIGIPSTSYTDYVPTSGTTFRYRVKATDSMGQESATIVSAMIIIDYNNLPTITLLTPADMGEQRGAFDVEVSLDDEDADDTIYLTVTTDDGMVLLNLPIAPRDTPITATLPYEVWAMAGSGTHTIDVTASDGKGATQQSITWTKTVAGIDVQTSDPIECANMPTAILLKPDAYMAANANQRYWACSNGFDALEDQVWEEITQFALNGAAYAFANNMTKTGQWGVLVRAAIAKNGATMPVELRLIIGVITSPAPIT